ncbi:hypothetical protein X801_02139 [Opisthorchis viverrini]|uniref:Uncharacterized protein n=2 Tax=Opisthorchis viverrini TaxID=6198 RepID=A0A1S8X5G3_OPIVI|nr:hypothetical protein X801_02139 [Opisthorchis viverrini]
MCLGVLFLSCFESEQPKSESKSMSDGRILKISYLVALIIAAVLGIVALSLNKSFGKTNISRTQCSDAFTLIGVLLILGAIILFLVVMVFDPSARRTILIVIFVAAAVGLLSYIIACGCLFSGAPNYGAWLLSAMWASVAAVAISIAFLFDDPFE